MGYSFLEFMKRAGIFIVCAQSMMHFAAGKSYEKYIKLLIGIMLLGQLMIPVRALFMGSENAEIWKTVEEFQEELEKAYTGAEPVFEELSVNDALGEEVAARLESIAACYGFRVEKASVSGEPPLITVTVSKGDKENNKIAIDKIYIASEDTKKGEKEADNNGKEAMRKEFADCLGTEEAYLEVRER